MGVCNSVYRGVVLVFWPEERSGPNWRVSSTESRTKPTCWQGRLGVKTTTLTTTTTTTTTMCPNNVCCRFSSITLKQLELMIIIFGTHTVLKLLAFTCIHNFPPHLSCVATLPDNILLASEQARCFAVKSVSGSIMDDATNWQPTNSSTLEISRTSLMCLWRIFLT